MTTVPETHPVDLRDQWLRRKSAEAFLTSPGVHSVRVIKSVPTWSWRPLGLDHTWASKVQVYRESGRLFVVVSDPRPDTRHERIESPRRPLRSWEQLEALVAALTEGEPMVPRVDSIDPVRVAS